MKTLVLADAHLLFPEHADYAALLCFLQRHEEEIDRLILLGDMFEFITGHPKTHFACYAPFIQRLDRLSARGVEIVYCEGNHDFNLASFFGEVKGWKVFADLAPLTTAFGKSLFCHGDLIDPNEKGYRLLRSFLRSRLIWFLMNLVPQSLIWHIAQKASGKSRRRRQRQPQRLVAKEVLKGFALKQWERGYPLVVTGHFHREWVWQEGENRLISLPPWKDQRGYLWLEEDRFTIRYDETSSPASS